MNKTQQLKDLYDKLGEIIKQNDANSEWPNPERVKGRSCDDQVKSYCPLNRRTGRICFRFLGLF